MVMHPQCVGMLLQARRLVLLLPEEQGGSRVQPRQQQTRRNRHLRCSLLPCWFCLVFEVLLISGHCNQAASAGQMLAWLILLASTCVALQSQCICSQLYMYIISDATCCPRCLLLLLLDIGVINTAQLACHSRHSVTMLSMMVKTALLCQVTAFTIPMRL